MKTKIRTLWKRIIMGMIPVVLIALLFSIFFSSCQQEEIGTQSDEFLKTAIIERILLSYPTYDVVAGEDFGITFSSTCGKIKIERGYVNGDPILDGGGMIIGYEKVYVGLNCETVGLLYEDIGNDDFLSCSGGTITETWNEPGTYLYRIKWNPLKVKPSDCASCRTFKGNQFECFMITVVEGNSGTFPDTRDGHVYKWVKIGDQIWMAENLAYQTETGSWAYDNDESNVAIHGRLYNWTAAKTACPPEWRLPSDAEWEQLEQYISTIKTDCQKVIISDDLYMWQNMGKYLKATTGWEKNGTDDFGFTGLPGGILSIPQDFNELNDYALWWSSTIDIPSLSVYCRRLTGPLDYFHKIPVFEVCGLSIRCIKDN